MRKILLIFCSFILLNACGQTTALIGPALTIGNTGNVMQAGFSYGSNMAVKHTTGKTPGEHVTSYVDEKKEKKKARKEIVIYLENHIENMRNKLSLKQ
tara:strand:+ start:3420 stop:3713 length:294 start_codon:yes stop_codon:yes gene_type:complete